MARVRVIEPMTGSVVEVDADSALAQKWQRVDASASAPEPVKKSPTKKAAPRKRTTTKKK